MVDNRKVLRSDGGGGGADTIFDYVILERPRVDCGICGHVVQLLRTRDYEISAWGMVNTTKLR